MAEAWRATERRPLRQVDCRVERVRLEPRGDKGFTAADLEHTLRTEDRRFRQCLAALGLSWRARGDAGHRVEVPVVDLGVAQVLLLPGESYVEFELAAQSERPDSFVVAAGYGECATGYIPTDRHIA